MDTNKMKPTEEQTNQRTVRWKLPEFRTNFMKKCLEGAAKQSGLPLTCLSGLVQQLERYEPRLNSAADNETEYCHYLSEKIKEVFSQLKTAGSEPCLPNFTASGEVFSTLVAQLFPNVDWKEQVYQKVQRMNSAYFRSVYGSYQRMNRALQQLQSSPQESNTISLETLRNKIKQADFILDLLRVKKCQITPELKELLDKVEYFLQTNFSPKNVSTNHEGQKHLNDEQSGQQSGPSQNYPIWKDVSQQKKISLKEQQEEKQDISPVKIIKTKPSPQALGTQNYPIWRDVSQQNKICLKNQHVEKQYSNSPQHVNQLSIMKGPDNAIQTQTHGALKATEAFSVSDSVNSRAISVSPLTENCNKHKEISPNSTLNFDEPSAEVKHILKVLTGISPEALSASISRLKEVVYLNDVMPTSEFLNGPPKMVQQQKQQGLIGQTGKNLASDIELFSQARYVTCNDFLPTRRKRPHNMNTMVAFHSFIQLSDAEKPDWTSVTYKRKKPRIVENCSLLQEIKEINNRLIDSEIVIGENNSFHKAPGGAAEDSEGLVIEFFFNAVTVNNNLISHISADKKSIIKPLRLFVPTNYPFSSPIIVDKKLLEGEKDLSTIAESKLRYSLRCFNERWSVGDIAMLWERCARETIVEHAKALGAGTFSSIYGGWEIY